MNNLHLETSEASPADVFFIPEPAKTYSSLAVCSPDVSQLYIKGAHHEFVSDEYIGRRIGIVGTRDATVAGLNDTRRLAQVVSTQGCVVVSGMALGVDGAAHQGALDVTGSTIAVLGSGVDMIYPNRHMRLAQDILKHGCIISEFDCGVQALPWHFPVRNRIIAALSDVLVVPEGTLKGGARITVDLALAMGKTVCALPGPRRNRASELPNSIIKDGAVCITDPADILREMGIDIEDVGWELLQPTTEKNEAPNKRTEKILAHLAHGPASALDIAHLCTYTERESMRLLSTLEQMGLVRYRRGMYEVT
ncbi:MAG TPA: DNA-processing protein DprA [Acidimicrobiia bacterium]|nr:DNA-processing protein DprA [Acidimicrobiia bacterium]